MTQADEESFERAKTATGTLPDGSQVHKLIHTTIEEAKATSAVQWLALSTALTLHDLDAVAAQVPAPALVHGHRVSPGRHGTRRIVYRPSFWFEAEVVLADETAEERLF